MKARHQHESWQIQADTERKLYCAVCGEYLTRRERRVLSRGSVRRWGPFWKFRTQSGDGPLEVAVATPWGRVGLRFGVEDRPLFSERYQGTRGIRNRYLYLLPGRALTLTLRERGRKRLLKRM